jgi:hypothetical protein
MVYVVEESDDCGVHWRRAQLTECYFHPRIAMLEALEIIKDKWRPPDHSLRQLVHALLLAQVNSHRTSQSPGTRPGGMTYGRMDVEAVRTRAFDEQRGSHLAKDLVHCDARLGSIR